MNKLTNEEKAKVFAMYLGCKIKCSKSGALADVCHPHTCADYGHWQLVLTSLSEITDEHAIICWDIENYVCSENDILHVSNILNEMSAKLFQYLTSKGYAVPLWFGIDHWANGKTAIELGLAIEKQSI